MPTVRAGQGNKAAKPHQGTLQGQEGCSHGDPIAHTLLVYQVAWLQNDQRTCHLVQCPEREPNPRHLPQGFCPSSSESIARRKWTGRTTVSLTAAFIYR